MHPDRSGGVHEHWLLAPAAYAGVLDADAVRQNYKANAAKNQPCLALIPGHSLCCYEHTITATCLKNHLACPIKSASA
ncbi:MAG: hypothetical protein SGPRY_005510 [Prymnesium sp.]